MVLRPLLFVWSARCTCVLASVRSLTGAVMIFSTVTEIFLNSPKDNYPRMPITGEFRDSSSRHMSITFEVFYCSRASIGRVRFRSILYFVKFTNFEGLESNVLLNMKVKTMLSGRACIYENEAEHVFGLVELSPKCCRVDTRAACRCQKGKKTRPGSGPEGRG